MIAIENVRLFQELQARTHDLSQSLEETGALSEVIRAVSSSLDLREVLDAVARRAVALVGGGRLRDLRATVRGAGVRRGREPGAQPPSS